MSTQQKTTSSQQQQQQQSQSSQGGFQNIYDPASMARYQQAQGQALGGLQSWAQNPLQNSFFNTLAQMSRQNIGQQGQSNIQSLLQNARTSGFNTSSPYMQSLMAQQARAQSGQQAQGFNALLGQMPQYQLQALSGLMGGFNPLQTGYNQQQSSKGNMTGISSGQQTQQTTGLGTWLPQLLGGGISALTGMMGGGGAPTSRGGGSLGLGGFPSPVQGFSNFGPSQNPFMAMPGGAAGMGSAGGINLGSMFTPGAG